MTLFDLILLLQVVLSGGATPQGGASFDLTVDIAATACGTTAQAAWDGFGMPFDPYEVAASDTQSADGCAQSSQLYPTVSLP